MVQKRYAPESKEEAVRQATQRAYPMVEVAEHHRPMVLKITHRVTTDWPLK